MLVRNAEKYGINSYIVYKWSIEYLSNITFKKNFTFLVNFIYCITILYKMQLYNNRTIC